VAQYELSSQDKCLISASLNRATGLS